MAVLRGEEARAWLAANPNKAYKNLTSGQSVAAQPSALMKILQGITKPFRMGAGVASDFGSTVGQLGRMAQGDTSSQELDPLFWLTEEENRQLREDPLRAGLKAGAGVAAYGVPVGAAKGVTGLKAVGQAGLKGAGAGALGGFGLSESGEELKGTLSGGVTGGLFAGALQGIGEVSKGIKAAKISNKLDDMADELQASALKKDIGIAPTTKQGKNILPKQISEKASSMGVKIKSPEDLKSFGQALYESNANVANQAAQQLDDLGRVIDITEIKRPLLEQLAKTKSPELQAPIQKVIDSIDNATGGSNAISASDLLNLRREWGKLGNWNPFMDPAATTTAGAFEAAYMRANDLLDDAFKGAGITGFKDANKAISLSIAADNWAERAIANKSNRPLWNDMTQDAAIAATVFGGGGPGAVAGAVGSKVAQRYAEPIAEKALRGVSKVTSGLGALPQILQPLVTAGQRAIPAVPGIMGDQGIESQEMGMGTDMQYGGQPQLDKMALAQAVMSGEMSVTEAKFLMDLLGGGTQGKLTKDQANAQAALQSLDTMESILGSDSSALPLSYLPFQGFNQNAQVLEQAALNIEDVIARMRTGAVINDEEAKRYRKMIPRITDTQQTKIQKIQQLRNIFGSILNQQGGSTQDSALMQMLGL